MRKEIWIAEYYLLQAKGTMYEVRCHSLQIYNSRALAMSSSYNQYDQAMVKIEGYVTILCDFYSLSFTLIYVNNGGSKGFVNNDKEDRVRFRRMAKTIFSCFSAREETGYEDRSVALSRWHWKLTLPVGYKLLCPGDVVKESDIEYPEYGRGEQWSRFVSHYNVGTMIGKKRGIVYFKNNVRQRREPDEISPIIARKIN